MKYNKIKEAIFMERPNRFIAKVLVDDKEETVHVKNTGRCKELLIKGCRILLEESDSEKRKTKYDLVSVYKDDIGWVNIDSQLPNKVVKEWLEKGDVIQGITYIKPECKYGDSRLDFYFEKSEIKCLMEVKGVTLFMEGKGFFPDAPTTRGTKHLRELINAKKEGYEVYVGFVVQAEGINEVYPNEITDKEFAKTLYEAAKEGVKVFVLGCDVREQEVVINRAKEMNYRE